MDMISAFARNMMLQGGDERVFDWDKAAQLIKESGYKDASAGLRDDWEETGGSIFSEGKPDDGHTYLASAWAIPEIEIDGEIIPCFRMQSEKPEWDAETKWPQSALDILQSE